MFGHISDADSRKKLMNGIKEMLRPGGTYIMEVYSDQQLPYQSGGGNDIRLLYTPEEVLTVFADWHFKHFYYGEAVRHEGNLHTGLGHVIQTVVHKPIL
ncbi:hypothetical protein [Halalkalibacter oceani]|uniref:hypothetical protein n=1 Tax=Halalkalibacter oceani TaxID=1653776 RepID=UPI0032E8026C